SPRLNISFPLSVTFGVSQHAEACHCRVIARADPAPAAMYTVAADNAPTTQPVFMRRPPDAERPRRQSRRPPLFRLADPRATQRAWGNASSRRRTDRSRTRRRGGKQSYGAA